MRAGNEGKLTTVPRGNHGPKAISPNSLQRAGKQSPEGTTSTLIATLAPLNGRSGGVHTGPHIPPCGRPRDSNWYALGHSIPFLPTSCGVLPSPIARAGADEAKPTSSQRPPTRPPAGAAQHPLRRERGSHPSPGRLSRLTWHSKRAGLGHMRRLLRRARGCQSPPRHMDILRSPHTTTEPAVTPPPNRSEVPRAILPHGNS